jgi:predicted phage tail component-like protein
MIFNSVKKDYLTVDHSFTLPTISEIEYKYQDLKDYGVRIKKRRIKELPIPVPVTIVDDGRGLDYIKKDLAEWLFTEDDKKLEFTHYPGYYYLARLKSIDLQDNHKVMKGTINFICQSPFKVGTGHTLSVTNSFQTFKITGQVSTPWVVEVRFTEKVSTFEFETNKGLYLLLQYDFIPGDSLIIKYEGRKVWLNGVDLRQAVRLKTNFEMLEPGEISVRASHECTLKYDERYY